MKQSSNSGVEVDKSIHAYVKDYTTLTLQILNLTDEDMLLHFMDGLKNYANTELER